MPFNVGMVPHALPDSWPFALSELGAWVAVLAVAALIVAMVAISKPIRTLAANSALPGAVGAGVGFIVTQEPSLAAGWWHHVAVAATVVVLFWAVGAVLANITRDRDNKRRRFAREAFRFAREVYNLIDEPKTLLVELGSAGGWDPEISRKLKKAQGVACSEYGRQYWIPLRNFFDELKDEGLLTDERVRTARELANTIEQHVFAHDDWEAVMKIEEMGRAWISRLVRPCERASPSFNGPGARPSL
jgi:hypothetical protein